MADLVGLFNLLAPFFGLIGLGFLCGRLSRQPAAGLAWMQFFLIYVALPCLFFALIADKPLNELANWPFILATTLCTAIAMRSGKTEIRNRQSKKKIRATGALAAVAMGDRMIGDLM